MTTPVPTITDEQIAEIEALANNAHIARSGHEWFSDADCCWWTGNADEGDFMAAASPKNILALISRLRAAERDAGRYQFMASACEITYMGTVIEDEPQLDRVMNGERP